MSFDKIFDLTAAVYFYFFNIRIQSRVSCIVDMDTNVTGKLSGIRYDTMIYTW